MCLSCLMTCRAMFIEISISLHKQFDWLCTHLWRFDFLACHSFQLSILYVFVFLYFTLFYYIFFLLVNFLQQTLVNFRLISVFTLFFQSLNQQNKTINTNNERKNQKRYCIDSLRACYLFFISAVFVV